MGGKTTVACRCEDILRIRLGPQQFAETVNCLIIHTFHQESKQDGRTRPPRGGTANVQNETETYGIPADRMTYTHHGLGAERELGEARIVSTRWGKTRVRIVHKDGKPERSPWFLPGAVAVIALIAGAVAWTQLHHAPTAETASNEPRLIVTLPATEASVPAGMSAGQASAAQPAAQEAAPETPAPAPQVEQVAAKPAPHAAEKIDTPAAQPGRRVSGAQSVNKQPAPAASQAAAPRAADITKPSPGASQDQPAKRAPAATRPAASPATKPAPESTAPDKPATVAAPSASEQEPASPSPTAPVQNQP